MTENDEINKKIDAIEHVIPQGPEYEYVYYILDRGIGDLIDELTN